MERPLNLTFRGLEKSPALETLVHERAARLERHCDHVIGVDVAIEKDQSTPEGASQVYRVRVTTTVPPGHEVVGKSKDPGDDAPLPLDVNVRNAFDHVERQLEKLTARQRGEVKSHLAQEPTGTVTKLMAGERYGFLMSDDGQEVYFRDEAVAGDRFDDLEVGAAVHFTATSGDQGPQATTVRVTDPRGLA